jgi:site-specific DNA-methyltransferase (adenine-specific)
LAWTSFSGSLRQVEIPLLSEPHSTKNRIHPCQKPIRLYKWLLTNYAKPGQTILDTHLGSGSSRIAAYDLGFDFTGYELDKDYYDAQEKRFANHIAQPKLFVPEPVAELQEQLF